MVADPSMTGPQTAVRLPVIVAIVTVVIAPIAGLVPALISHSSQSTEASSHQEAAIATAAEGVQKTVRGFLDGKATALNCLSSDTNLETQITKALEPLPELPEPTKEGEGEPSEPSEAAKAAVAADKAIKAARESVNSRIKGFCGGLGGCKRLLIASKQSVLLFSTAEMTEGDTLGGTLVTSAIDSAIPVMMVAESLTSQLGGPAVVAAAMPSKERVVLAAFEMTELYKTLNTVKTGIGSGARVILVDGRRTALLGGLESQRGKALEIEPVTRALKGESASARTADEEDKVIVTSFRPIAEAGMAIVVTRREDDIGNTGASFPWGGIIGAFVIGLIGAIILFVLVRKALDPLGLLHQAAGRVAQGDLSERVPVLTEDEVGDISKVWNDVVARLQKAEGGGRGGDGR